jgi:RNA polymerase sigma-70 factor (ECF subfamily)
MASLLPRLRALPAATAVARRASVPPFDELVARHQGAVRAFLRRLGDDDAVADDLAQETFLKAQRALASYRGDGSVASWLLRIAYREFLSSRRGLRHRNERVGAVDDAAAAEPPDADSARRADRSVERDVRRALRVLSEDERAAIAACFYEGLTHEEAAAALEMPLGTLKSHVARAREKLRGPLAAYAPPSSSSSDVLSSSAAASASAPSAPSAPGVAP